jgi:hypothetical protein
MGNYGLVYKCINNVSSVLPDSKKEKEKNKKED